jgi:hypothetical protein
MRKLRRSAMRPLHTGNHRLSCFLSLLATCCFAVSAQAAPTAAKSGKWSAKSTWVDGVVPAPGSVVTIPEGTQVELDVSPPALNGLTINGRLAFADKADIELTTEWIMLHGELQIGTAAKPHTRNATITLTDNVKGEDVMGGMGDRGIMISGGTLNLHGNRTHTWTKLSKTAEAGATSIEVLDASGWKAGDQIVLASTDFDPRQAEKRIIRSVRGNTITLDRPLEYMHFGRITFGVDERGEVGLLTRNVKVQASEDAAETHFGGHIMAMPSSRMFVSGVELHRMGQHMVLARYPIHWHLVGDAKGQYIRNAAIHDTFSRCVTVHGTDNLRIENNVTYNNVGHCFFLEDGIEKGNQFVRNLAIQTKCHPTKECVPVNLAANGEITAENPRNIRQVSFSGKDTLLPSDNTVASYWITNPGNYFIENVAAGSDQIGFWFSIPEHPNGQFLNTEVSKNTWSRRMPLGAFKGNVAHSNFDGVMIDRHINEDNTFGTASIPWLPLKDPTDLESEVMETHFEDLTSYKNRNGGLWGRGDLYVYKNAKFADNAIGMTQAAGDIGTSRFSSLLIDSLVVGETENIGNPRTPEEIAYGRSLPKRLIPDFPIRGYEFYDYRDDVVNTTFMNFQDNELRKTGALSFLLFTSAGLSTNSAVKGAKFVNAKPVYFPKFDTRFDNDNRGGNTYRTLSFRDLDGSVTGIPNSQVLLHDGESDSVATDDTCVIQPSWNASVCTGDIGRVNFSDARGELPRAVDLESRTARFSLLASIGGGAYANTPLGQAQRAALFSRRPAQPPVTLFRNGKEFKVFGDQSTVKAGTEIQVRTEREEVTLSISEMDAGSWVIFELPGFAKATGTEQKSLDALRQAKETSWFRDGNRVWVKLVAAPPVMEIIRPTDLQASITVSRAPAAATAANVTAR